MYCNSWTIKYLVTYLDIMFRRFWILLALNMEGSTFCFVALIEWSCVAVLLTTEQHAQRTEEPPPARFSRKEPHHARGNRGAATVRLMAHTTLYFACYTSHLHKLAQVKRSFKYIFLNHCRTSVKIILNCDNPLHQEPKGIILFICSNQNQNGSFWWN
jgi:hypothetical protein